MGRGRGAGLGTSESKLISSNGVIVSKIVKAHGVLQRESLQSGGALPEFGLPEAAPYCDKAEAPPCGLHQVMQYSTNLLR